MASKYQKRHLVTCFDCGEHLCTMRLDALTCPCCDPNFEPSNRERFLKTCELENQP